jgi:cysteine synthase A
MDGDRRWVNDAISKLEADFNRSADTHLFELNLPGVPGINLYIKDESVHPTGSLKHRLARSLFLFGLCNGWIYEQTTIIEASSGNTAVSEAYFARLLGLKFIAVVPKSTSHQKVEQIKFYGGDVHFVEKAADVYPASRKLAVETGGHYMDQFTYAEKVTDWRGNNNIAESIFSQMSKEPHPVPAWLVCSAGTGGTSATLGRFVRYQQFDTKVCVADPENSVFYDFYQTGDCDLTAETGSRVEGIGRPRVEASFIPSVIDQMIRVPDAASFAAIHVLHEVLDKRFGGSTGTNIFAALQVANSMQESGQNGSIVTLACDPGDRYSDTYFDQNWLSENGHNIAPYREMLLAFIKTGKWNQGI